MRADVVPRAMTSGRMVRDAFSQLGRAQTRRNRLIPIIQFALPLVIIVFVGVSSGGIAEPVYTVGVVEAAQTAAGNDLVMRLDADPDLKVRSFETPEDMRVAVVRGRVVAGIELGADWPRAPSLRVFESSTEGSAFVALALIEASVTAADIENPQAIDVELIGDGDLADLHVGFQYGAPAMTVLFAVIGGLFMSTMVIDMRERGLLQRILAAPVRVWDLFGAFAVVPTYATAFQAVFLILVTWLAFGVRWGDPLGVALVTIALALTSGALMLAASTLFRNTRQAQILGPLIGIVMGMLGGCIWPLFIVPEPLVVIGHLVPTAWAMDAYLALGFGRASVVEVLPQVGVLTVMAAVLGFVGVARVRSTLVARVVAV